MSTAHSTALVACSNATKNPSPVWTTSSPWWTAILVRDLAVVPAEQFLPGLVADQPDEVGRGHDVGEHERPSRPGRGDARIASDLLEQTIRARDVECGSESLEDASSRPQIPPAAAGSPSGSQGARVYEPGARGFVGQIRLVPQAQRLGKHGDRLGRSLVMEEHSPSRGRGRGPEQWTLQAVGRPFEFLGRRSCGLVVTLDERDLDLGWQEPRPPDQVRQRAPA